MRAAVGVHGVVTLSGHGPRSRHVDAIYHDHRGPSVVEERQLYCGEHITRRILQILAAVRRNPNAPDFEGLDAYMRHMADGTGQLRAPKFGQHIAALMKEEAVVLKQTRLAREEAVEDKTQKKPKGKGKGDDAADA